MRIFVNISYTAIVDSITKSFPFMEAVAYRRLIRSESGLILATCLMAWFELWSLNNS